MECFFICNFVLMSVTKGKKKPHTKAKAKTKKKGRKKQKSRDTSILKHLRLSKQDKQTIKLGIAITLALFLSMIFFQLCTEKDSYAGRYFYANEAFNIVVEGKEMYDLHGLDISHHQGKLDWETINEHKINDKPISFVFIKATEGINHQDRLYAYNRQEAKARGFICGAYHYYKDNVSAYVQAKNFIHTAKLKAGDLAPVLDVEELDAEHKNQSIQSILRILKSWEKHYGVKPIFYTYDYLYRSYFRGTELDDYPLWIANYSLPDEELPPYAWSFWQYSSKGRLNDCVGDFDLNVFRTSIDDFRQYLIK